MNLLELMNRCLLELNYKQVNTFSELVKNDHKRIKTILNLINKEICNSERWNFLLRRDSFVINANSSEITNPINGKILYLVVDGKKYDFTENVEGFVTGHPKSNTYSSLGDKLLFPKFDKAKTAEVVYYTNNCATSKDGSEKVNMEYEYDKTLIPMPFAEQLLVYGTCLRLKANPQYFKFPYWMSMYQEALRNLKSKSSVSVLNAPVVNLFRK